MEAGRRWPDKGIFLSAQFGHPGFVSKYRTKGNAAAWVDGEHGHFVTKPNPFLTKQINQGAFSGTGNTGDRKAKCIRFWGLLRKPKQAVAVRKKRRTFSFSEGNGLAKVQSFAPKQTLCEVPEINFLHQFFRNEVQDAEFMKCPKESPGSLFKSMRKSLFPNPLSKPIFVVRKTGLVRKSQLEEMQIPSEMDNQKIPRHIAIIMDGNGRWARQQGMAARIFGHRNAIKAVREATEGCAELGVKFLTLYAFSTENWGRPKEEVMALMELLVQTIR
jgi:hypothetical protein